MLHPVPEPKSDPIRVAASQVPPAPSLEALGRDRLQRVVGPLGLLHLLASAAYVFGLQPGTSFLLSDPSLPTIWFGVSPPLLATVTGVFLLILGCLLPQLPMRWADPLGALVATLSALNCLAWSTFDGHIEKIAPLAVVVVCVGFFLFSIPWLAWVNLIAVGGWGIVIWQLNFPTGWIHLAGTLAGASALAFVVQRLQLRSLRDILTGCKEVVPIVVESAPANNEEAEERFRSWYEATFEGIAIHEKGVVIEANPILGRLLGCSAAELVGTNLLDRFTLASRNLVGHSILLGNYRPFEAIIRRPDKTEVPLELFSKELLYQGKNVMVTAFRDLTERQRAAAALQAEQQRLELRYRRQTAIAEIEFKDQPSELQELIDHITRAAARHLPAQLGTCTMLHDGHRWSLAAVHFTPVALESGFSPTAQLGALADWILAHRESYVASNATQDDPFHVNEPVELVRSYVGQPLVAEGKAFGVLFALDSEPRQFKVEDLDFLATLAGRTAAVISKIRLYQKVHEANRLLEENSQMLLSKNVELAEAKEAAESAKRARGDLLTIMSHELRTPLNGVLGMTNILHHTDLSSEQRDYLVTLQTSAESLLNSINRMLDFLNLDTETKTKPHALMDVRRLLGEVLEIFRNKAQGKPIEFKCSTAEEMVGPMRGNGEAVRQVLLNLLDNAVKFTERGQVAVSVAPHQEANGHVLLRFTVSDSGIGIPVQAQTRMFESFTQLDASNSRRYGGLGLGLAICKQLVERLGGQIGVESAPGHGSDFWFTIPFERPMAGADAASEAPVSL